MYSKIQFFRPAREVYRQNSAPIFRRGEISMEKAEMLARIIAKIRTMTDNEIIQLLKKFDEPEDRQEV